MYSLEMPVESERRIIKQCYSDRIPLPKRVQNAPSLWTGLELYYSAFMELHSTRPSSMGVGPIPWTAIKDYAFAYDLDSEQTQDLFYFVRTIDNAYLSWESSKS